VRIATVESVLQRGARDEHAVGQVSKEVVRVAVTARRGNLKDGGDGVGRGHVFILTPGEFPRSTSCPRKGRSEVVAICLRAAVASLTRPTMALPTVAPVGSFTTPFKDEGPWHHAKAAVRKSSIP
jgi:hypothetical protein